nr:alpha/beta fold hydrolase [Streptomyces showdoensis]
MAAVLTATACASGAPGSGPAASRTAGQSAGRPADGPPPGASRLTGHRPCPGQPDVTCADLKVPLDRDRDRDRGRDRDGARDGGRAPDGGRTRDGDHAVPAPATLTLRTAIYGKADAPRGTLLFLTGGPGQPGVPFVAKIRTRMPAALAGYRLVMVDQRGTGGGAIDCPVLQKEVGSSDTVVPTPTAVTSCAEGLGRTRNFYTTADTVADLEDLRRALGVPDWTVDGVSYGTFTAARYALTHPGRVRRLVLDSVVPPEGAGVLYEAAFGHSGQVLRAACREQKCGFDPARDLAQVVRRDGNGVGVFNLLVIASIIDPKLDNPDFGILNALHSSAGGDPARLDGLVAGFSAPSDEPPEDFSSGLHAATLCADSHWPWGDSSTPVAGRRKALDRAVRRIDPAAVWPFERRTAGEQGIPQTCLPWPVSRPNRPAPGRTLTMPVLLLAGDRDLSTPVAWARDLAARTPKARLVVIEGAGHSTQSRSAAGARAAEEFLLSRDG